MTDWDSAEEHVDRALELFQRGRLDEAEHALRLALELVPHHGDWLFRLGMTLDAAGRLDEAIDSYLEAADVLPEDGEIMAAAGIALCKARRSEEGITLLRKACTLLPDHEEAWAHLIGAHNHLGQYSEAESAYFLAQQYVEEYPNCLFVMGESLFEQGQLDRAAWCFREAARQDPGLPRVRARLGAVLAASGRTHRALRMYLQDLRENPGSPQTLLEFGDLLVDLGRYSEAEEKYHRVLELQPADVDAHHRLAQLSMRLGRHEQAVNEFELVRSLDPDNEKVVLELAKALLELKRTREARRLLVEHSEFLDKNASCETIRNLADLLLAAGLPGITTDLLEEASTRFPADIGIMRRFAFARFDSGDTRGGDRLSRRLVRMDPTLSSMHENLVLSALHAGRPKLARLRVQRALDACPGDERLRRLRALIIVRWLPSLLQRLQASRNNNA